MDWDVIRAWFTLENISELTQQYRALGPIPGIVLPMLEAFLPFLPLFVFVTANVTAFGLWWGFFFLGLVLLREPILFFPLFENMAKEGFSDSYKSISKFKSL